MDTDKKQNNLSVVGTWIINHKIEAHTIFFRSNNTDESYLIFENIKRQL